MIGKILFFLAYSLLIFFLILREIKNEEMTKLAFEKCAERNNKIMHMIDVCVDRGARLCFRYEKKEANICDYPEVYRDLIINYKED